MPVLILALLAAALVPEAPPPIRTQPDGPPPDFTPPPIVSPRPPPAPPSGGRANLASYVSNDDYPAEALWNDEEGTTGFRLTVGTNGRVTDCEVFEPSGSASLDETTCRILQARARFTPAIGSDGNPIEDRVDARIHWRLTRDEGEVAPKRARPIMPLASLVTPEDYPQAARDARAEGTTHFSLSVDANGRVGDCIVIVPSASPALDSAACQIMRTRARFTPARTPDGVPTADEHRGHINWRLPVGAAPRHAR